MTERRNNSALRGIVSVAESAIHGRGVFAAREIASGEYIGTFHGPEAQRDGCYVLWVYDENDRPTGRRGRNLLRYLNHERPCNAQFEDFDLYALRSIARGEEITIDYGGVVE
jgi:hypothetical protein